MKTSLATLLAIVAVLGTYAEEAAPQPATAQDPAAMLTPEETAPAPQSEESKAPAAEEKANEAPDDTGVPVPVQPNEQKAAAAQQPLREEDTDEIDLEEVDDSAEAAKKPQINVSDENVEFVDISCDEATLADILRQFRKTTRANIISDDSTNLQKRVSAELRHVPWLNALESLLVSRGFRMEQRGDIYFVQEDKQAIPIITRSFQLNHASAEDLSKLFNANYAEKDKQGKVVQNIATPFASANTIVVTAPEKVIRDCEAIIKAVDRAVPQIYIEARFLELSSAAMHKLGIDWSSLESWRVSAAGLKAGWESNHGRAANYGEFTSQRTLNTSMTDTRNSNANATGADDSSVSSALSSTQGDNTSQTIVGLVPASIGAAARAGIDAADMAWKNASGFSGQLSAQDFSLAMSAFESLGEGKIFSNPKVIVSNGKEAKVDMTTKFPNVDVSSQRNTSTTTPYTDISTKIQVIPGDKDKGLFSGDIFYSWGITLSVKPRISPDGLISVAITPTISQLDTSGISDAGFYKVGSASPDDTSMSAYSKYPVIEMKRISTEFTMKDGATAVIGGLSKTVEEDIDTGIPFLRKLPWIGQKLFGWKGREKVQKEIVVCVTIGIADPANLPKDMGLPQNAVIGREYVEGRRLEPGLRKGGADIILAVDTEDLDDQRKKRMRTQQEKRKEPAEAEQGNVSITISKEQ